MARYDVFRTRREGYYLLDAQNDLIDEFDTRVVVPLLPLARTPKPIPRLQPVFDMNGEMFVMATQLLSAVSATELRQVVANLDAHHSEITTAVDVLLGGV